MLAKMKYITKLHMKNLRSKQHWTLNNFKNLENLKLYFQDFHFYYQSDGQFMCRDTFMCQTRPLLSTHKKVIFLKNLNEEI